MPARPILGLFPLLLVLATAAVGRAQDAVRYYEQDGVTYCETKRTVHRPISETHYEDQQRTAYVEQYQTQMQAVPRTYSVPVTEYIWEPYWVNRWNPFAQKYIAYRYVPRVRWETRTDTVQIPSTVRTLAPLQQTVKVPVTTQRMADEEQISRVAVSIRLNCLVSGRRSSVQPV